MAFYLSRQQPEAGLQRPSPLTFHPSPLVSLVSLTHQVSRQNILGASAMDATPGSKKAPPAAAAADAVPSAARQAAEQSPSSPESDAAVAGVKASGGGEDDDEQVERFYALLDNIRAMRGMFSSTGGAAALGRKRAREAVPPWRPAFRMEDFELEEVDSDSVGCAGEKKKKKRESSASVKRLAAAEEEEEEEEGEVVEAKGHPRRGQPQSHKARRAGALAVDT
ncbi:NRR repressor homolog 1-like [Miscanthus floridulus]|uniref:NRR repressor homolog 1-like n=1 Tax=Miscanthus floridulus TaxID=154761 RepID=UPI003459BDD1